MAEVWFYRNDMVVRLDKFRTSTMSTSAYINNSTGIRVAVWSTTSTGSTGNRVVEANLPYVSGTDGRYQRTIQSTEHSLARGTVGKVIVTAKVANLDARWAPLYRVDERGST